jgi:tritrans,polycis-undecaprenyl-diphosphate synthase [geranylgeranyl-diphosphate specific]
LLKEVLEGPVPKHIAIIMDGNRRFAKELGIDPTRGHLKGKDKLEEVTDWCLEVDVKILTVFAFSTENLKRKSEEIDWLMKLFADNFRRAGDDERAHKYGIKVRAIGQRSLLPKEVQDAIAYAEEKTKNYTNYLFNIAVAYGSREEMLRAIRNIAEDVKNGKLDSENINEKVFSTYLYTADLPDPDLVLRTSGEERVSNFLLWQLAYSELYFADIYWPGFRKVDFLRAIRSYQKRQRRYGK